MNERKVDSRPSLTAGICYWTMLQRFNRGCETGARSRRDMLGLLERHRSVAYQESLLTMGVWPWHRMALHNL